MDLTEIYVPSKDVKNSPFMQHILDLFTAGHCQKNESMILFIPPQYEVNQDCYICLRIRFVCHEFLNLVLFFR